jgi:predicted nucleic acid-binding protein
VLVDTPIWSLLFRRSRGYGPEVDRLRELIEQGQAILIGPVRQEVLSGIRGADQFIRVRDALRAFADHPITVPHFERAAEFYNTCRTRGIQGSNTDFLICALADLDQLHIFTTDKDFSFFARYLPIRLLS